MSEQAQEERRCQKEGCNTPPYWIGESGWCRAHDPALAEQRIRDGQKGAEAANAKKRRGKLDLDDLPDLDSPKAAAEWCNLIGLATATGTLTSSRAQALMRVVSEWRKAFDSEQNEKRIRALQDEIRDLKRTRRKAR